jgi:hypothetical protein
MFHLSVQEFTRLERQSNSWNDLVMQHLTSIGGTRTHAPMREVSAASAAGAASAASAGDENKSVGLPNINTKVGAVGDGRGAGKCGKRRKRGREDPYAVPAGMRHALKPLRKMPGRENVGDARVRCAVCGGKGSVYCVECTECAGGKGRGIYGLCCPSSGRVCACKHWWDMVSAEKP